jgi:hypothetical protein
MPQSSGRLFRCIGGLTLAFGLVAGYPALKDIVTGGFEHDTAPIQASRRAATAALPGAAALFVYGRVRDQETELKELKEQVKKTHSP